MLNPRSTGMSTPVMYDESSLARNSAAMADLVSFARAPEQDRSFTMR
jgi:hypothetical protein